MKTFYWDFFGPNAQRTAQHFLVHLERFLAENACAGCGTGLASEGGGHAAVWCRCPPAHEASIERALRPRRVEASVGFDEQADVFESRAGLPAAICRDVARSVIELAAVGRGDLVVEIGPGTGQIGAELVEAAPRYLGLDSSERMLAVFRTRLGAPRAGVDLVLGDAGARWPVDDANARCVFGSRSLHLLPPRHVAAEAERVADPKGGLLVIGRVQRERDSIREKLRKKLRELLAGGSGARGRAHAGELLSECVRRGATELPAQVVARWEVVYSIDDVLARWAEKPDLGKMRLSAEEQRRILDELRLWAISELGSAALSRASAESYVLQAARFG